MISQTAEYALRAMVSLANHPDTALTTQQIAKLTRVPAGYLSKVLQALGRSGLVTSQRGLHGGFTLGRHPRELTVLEVVNAVDTFKRIERCPLGLPSHGRNLCPLHKRLDDAIALVEKAFRDTTLEELLSEGSSSRPLDLARSPCRGLSVAETE